MKFEQILKSTLELQSQQKMELRTELHEELIQQMQTQLEVLLDAGYDNPNDLFDKNIETVIDAIPDAQLKEVAQAQFKDLRLRLALLDYSADFCRFSTKTVVNFTNNFIFDINNGVFPGINKDEKGNEVVDWLRPLKPKRDTYQRALVKPEAVEQEIQDLNNLVRQQGTVKPGTMAYINELTEALRIKELYGPVINNATYVLGRVLTQRDQKNRPVLLDFLQELTVLKKLNFIFSERIQKRFVKKFFRINKNSKQEGFKHDFLNTIGEYVMVGMGVVEPDLFSRQQADLNDEYYLQAKDSLGKLGVDLDKLLDYYDLQGSGTIFWNRWAVKGQKLGFITDELVRDFITQTVRADGEEILTAVDFDNFFAHAKLLITEGQKKSKEERESLSNEIAELLVKTLDKTEVNKTLIELIKNKWYNKLDIFYKKE